MKLKKKILFGYGAVFFLMGLVVVWSVVNLVSLGKASSAILSENYRSILAAENMVDALERQDSGILLMYLGVTETGSNQFRENETVFFQWMARAKDNITIEGERNLVELIEEDYAAYRKHFFVLTEQTNTRERSLLYGSYQETVFPLFTKVRDGCIALRKLNEDTMYTASVKAGVVAKRAIWSTVLVAGSSLLVALVFSFILSERMVKPIRRFMDASRKISEGDYSVLVPVDTGDELGQLAQEFNEMTTKLLRYHEMNIEQIIAEKNKGEAILSSIEDGLVVFDSNLKITGINPAAREILGVTLSETTLLQCADIIPDSEVCDLIRKTVETGLQQQKKDEQQVIVLTTGNQTRHFLFSVTAIRGRDRILSGIVLLLRDVTRLKEVEKLKSEFIMAASHELRTPLTSLGMSVDLLLEHSTGVLPEKDQELLTAAHEEVYRMKALVNDLLDLSRIEAGKIDMEFERVQVSMLFDHVRTVFRSQLDIKKVQLKSGISGEIPPVWVDANKITWVLTNLVSNALRYVNDGGVIQLKAYRTGSTVYLSVQDNGPGIPQKYQSRIFQKFVQVEGQKTEGSGLGLAICKEIVRAHGGSIWVESTPGSGSIFTFTLQIRD